MKIPVQLLGAPPGSSTLNINGLTEDTSPDSLLDFVPTYDTSATSNKKVKPINLTKGNPAASMSRNSTQSIPQNVTTKVQFSTEDYDVGNICDPTTNFRITVPVAGIYSITMNLLVSLSSAGATGAMYIYKNGAVLRGVVSQQTDSGDMSFVLPCEVLLAANDYIEGYFTHNSVSAKNVGTNGTQSNYVTVSLKQAA